MATENSDNLKTAKIHGLEISYKPEPDNEFMDKYYKFIIFERATTVTGANTIFGIEKDTKKVVELDYNDMVVVHNIIVDYKKANNILRWPDDRS